MKIRKAKEQRDGSIEAEVDGVKMFIPKDPANRHYRALLDAEVSTEQAEPEPAAVAPLTAEALLEELKGLGVIGANVTAESVMQRRRERRR